MYPKHHIHHQNSELCLLTEKKCLQHHQFVDPCQVNQNIQIHQKIPSIHLGQKILIVRRILIGQSNQKNQKNQIVRIHQRIHYNQKYLRNQSNQIYQKILIVLKNQKNRSNQIDQKYLRIHYSQKYLRNPMYQRIRSIPMYQRIRSIPINQLNQSKLIHPHNTFYHQNHIRLNLHMLQHLMQLELDMLFLGQGLFLFLKETLSFRTPDQNVQMIIFLLRLPKCRKHWYLELELIEYLHLHQ